MYIIETRRLGLRNWVDADLPKFAEMNSDPRVMEFYQKLLSVAETEEMLHRITNHLQEKGFGLWAVEIRTTKEFIGYVGLMVPKFQAAFTPCVEVGWRLAHKHWGKGYAPEAANECLLYGFNQLQLTEIVSFTSLLNTRSIQVMKKIGMKYRNDFEHPLLEPGNRLRTHVLYAKNKDD